MPVRFRCSYCNQLLGISRRKIGLPVKCPTCQGQVIVPPHDTEEKAAAPAPEPVVAPQRQFEHSDFMKMLEPQPAASERPRPQTQQPMLDFPIQAVENEPEIDVVPLPRTAAAGGMVLTPKKLTLLIIALIVAMALAFAAGVLVGMAMGKSAEKESSSEESLEYPNNPHACGMACGLEV